MTGWKHGDRRMQRKLSGIGQLEVPPKLELDLSWPECGLKLVEICKPRSQEAVKNGGPSLAALRNHTP
jgi:hypothetical protein